MWLINFIFSVWDFFILYFLFGECANNVITRTLRIIFYIPFIIVAIICYILFIVLYYLKICDLIFYILCDTDTDFDTYLIDRNRPRPLK